MKLRHDRRHVVLRQREDDADRLQLGDHDKAVGIGRLHVIARIDLAQPYAAGDRRNDVAISKIDLLGLDRTLVACHQALILVHQEQLILGLLPGDAVLPVELCVALGIASGLGQQRLVTAQRT